MVQVGGAAATPLTAVTPLSTKGEACTCTVGSRLRKASCCCCYVRFESAMLSTGNRDMASSGGKSQAKRRTCHGWDPWLPAASAVWSVGARTQTGYCALRRRVPQDGAGFSCVGAS